MKHLPDFKVYVNNLMAMEATQVFRGNVLDCFDQDAMELISAGVNPLSFRGLETAVSTDDSVSINFDPNPNVIISASGMCDAVSGASPQQCAVWTQGSWVFHIVDFQCIWCILDIWNPTLSQSRSHTGDLHHRRWLFIPIFAGKWIDWIKTLSFVDYVLYIGNI